MRFYLIRHGQTDWNRVGKIQGRTDIPLNEAGLLQARQLARAVSGRLERERGAAAVYSSTLQRALQTTREVAEACCLPVKPLVSLRERDFGLWEGKTWSEVEREDSEAFSFWENNPAQGTPTGGESRESCLLRCREAVEQMVKETEDVCKTRETTSRDVVVVAHGGILVFLIDYLLRAQREKKEIIVTNASISVVEYEVKTGVGRLLELNDIRHLDRSSGKSINKYC